MSYVSEFTSFVRLYPHLAYGLVFSLALSESLPVLGAVVPGTAIIVGLATLVPSGVLKLYPLLIAALVGAMVGDGLSFWLGHRYHREILVRWPFRRYPQLIERSETFFRKHGGKSVFLARFTPGLRAFVPLVAGMLKMPVSRFYAANILSAFIWAPLHVLPGVLLGAYVHSADDASGRLAILVLVLGGVIWLTSRGVRIGFQRGLPVLQARLDRLRHWASTHDNWLINKVAVLIDPTKPETAVLAGLAIILVAAIWLFFGILEDVVTGDPLIGFDRAVFDLIQSLRTSWGDAVMIALTELGDAAVVVPVTIAVLLWLLWKRAWRTSAYFLAAVAAASIFNTVIKVAIHRARPVGELYTGWSNFSFPSGHSTENAVLYGFLAILICRNLTLGRRISVAFAAALLVVLIAFSRVYLGAHWFSDVLAGLAFATIWLAALSIAYLHHGSSDERTEGVLIVAAIALVAAGSINVVRHHRPDTERYAVKYDVPVVQVTDWWQDGWRDLPARRVDLTGETEEPFSFQWAGSLEGLRSALERGGWQVPAAWTMGSALRWFGTTSPMELPAFLRLERGAMPSLTLIHADEENRGASRYVLRIWATYRHLRDKPEAELWLGSVVEEEFKNRLPLVTYPVTKNNFSGPRNLLSQALLDYRLASRSGTAADVAWDGNVLLSRDTDLMTR